MTNFPLYTLDSAPEGSKTAMGRLKEAFGTVPNVAAAMATSPVLIDCLAAVFQRVHAGSFSEAQIQVLLLTNAVTNAAEWAVGFHSFLALRLGVSALDVEAIRRGGVPSEPKAAALSRLARRLIETRGRIADADVAAFLDAGFGREQLLETIAVTSASTITNYAVSVTRPPLEAPFDAHAWQAP